MKVIYIAGYGRSGSTVLDIVLGNHSQITSLGEAAFLFDEWDVPSRRCSCAKPYRECMFWRDLFVNRLPSPDAAPLRRRVESLSAIPRLLLRLVAPTDIKAYRSSQKMLFEYVISRADKPIVVDSSKTARATAGRFFALSRIAGEDVYVLHLVRNGLATMESVLLGSNWAIEGYIPPRKWPAIRAAIGWVSSNVCASVLGRLIGPKRYMLLRYEDFLAEPTMTLRRIGRFAGFDSQELACRLDNDEYFQVGHNVGGNRVRLQGRIRLRKYTNRSYGDRLKLRHRLFFAVVCGWLHRLYGYL